MRNYLTFDIGGSLIKYGVINENGNLLYNAETDTEAHLGGVLIMDKVKQIGHEMQKNHSVEGVCISTAGQVDSISGKILYAAPDIIPDYTGMAVKEELEAFFSLPVEVENDVNCAGLAESWIGRGKNVNSLFCLTIGTGIGGSFILDKQLQTGYSYSGGEIGYMLVNDDQTFQQAASPRQLITYVSSKKNVDVESLNGENIFNLAKNGDQDCIDGIERMVKQLGKGISTIIYMLNPEMVVIGGGISAQENYLRPLIYKELEKIMVPNILNQTKIEFAGKLNNAGLIGALRNFLIKETLYPLNKVVASINTNRNKLTKKEELIAEYIVNNLSDVPTLTINEMAKRINVGEASISRFTKKIDVGSYNHLKMHASLATSGKKKLEGGNNHYQLIKTQYDEVMTRFEDSTVAEEIAAIKEILESDKRFFLVGQHSQAKELGMLKNKLLALGYDIQLFADHSQRELSKKILNDSIQIIIFDVEGDDSDLSEYAEEVKAVTHLTGLTSQTDSLLGRYVDTVFVIPFSKNDGGTNDYELSFYFFMDLLLNALIPSREESKSAIENQQK